MKKLSLRLTLTVATLLTGLSLTAPATADIIYVPTAIFSENFNSGLPGAGWSQGGPGTVSPVTGTAQLADSGGELAYYTTTTFSGQEFTVEADVNQINGSIGGSSSGMLIGNIAFTFFGGFNGATQGAFNILRVNPATGGILATLRGDTDMTYVPAQGVFQHYTIEVDPFTNTFDIEISNTAGPGVFNLTEVIPTFVPGGVGFYNWASDHQANFDNIQVIVLQEFFIVPEPATALMVTLGAAGLVWQGRRRRANRSACD